MTPEKFAKVRLLFLAARERPYHERAAFLTVECAGDSEIQEYVLKLLDAEHTTADFLTIPALGNAIDLRRLISESSETDPLIGHRLGKYVIKTLIAAGGMGRVYEAEQDKPHRTVAVKLIRHGLNSRSAFNRFVRESEVLASLSHPGIAQVFEAGHHNDGYCEVPFFAMEYVCGAKTILEHANQTGLNRRARLELFRLICDAIQHAHQRGVIHRDLKASNILVNAEGHPKIIDFGVAHASGRDLRMTTFDGTGIGLVGTPLYMSPEQFTDPAGVDTRSDVYSLGVVLYEMICGRLPYDLDTDSVIEVARIVGQIDPVMPSAVDPAMDDDLQVILLKALAKDRTHRYQSAAELEEDIRLYLGGEPILARPPTFAYRVARLVSRRKWQTATAVSVLLIASMGGVAGLFAHSAQKERNAKELIQASQYASLMTSVEGAIRSNDVPNASQLLARCDNEYRQNWEWKHLYNRIDLSLETLPQSGLVAALACSPDGRWLAVSTCIPGTINGELWLWRFDSETMHFSRGPALRGAGSREVQIGRASSLAFDIRGERLAATMPSGEVWIWDRGSKEWSDVVTPSVHKWFYDATCVAFCPSDDDVVGVVGSTVPNTNRQAWMAQISRDSLLAKLPSGELGDGHVITFSPARSVPRVAVTNYNGDYSVRLYDITNPTAPVETAVLLGHTFHTWGASFRLDGKLLATCSMDKSIRLWDVTASELEHGELSAPSGGRCIDILRDHADGVTAVVFNGPNQESLVSCGGLVGRLWTPDPKVPPLSIGDRIDEPAVRSPFKQRRDSDALRGHQEKVRCVIADPRGYWIATGSDDKTVRIWSSNAVDEIQTLRGHKSSVWDVAFSADGSLLVSASADNAILWNPTFATHTATLDHKTGEEERIVRAATFHPSRQLLATCGDAGLVKLWDISSLEHPTLFCPPIDLGFPVYTIAFNTTGSVLYHAGEDGIVRTLYLDENLQSPAHDLSTLAGNSIETLAVSPNGKLLAAGTGTPTATSSRIDGEIAIWDLSAPATAPVLLKGHNGGVKRLRFRPDGKLLASAGADGEIIMWDIRTWKPTRLPTGHTDQVLSLAFHPTQPRLASGSKDKTIRIWNLDHMTEAAVLHGHSGDICGLAFSPNGNCLASCSRGDLGNDNVVKLWESEMNSDSRRIRANHQTLTTSPQ